MFGLFCKGLHCAGCGKGIPASLVLVILGIVAISNKNFDNAIGSAIEIAAFALSAAIVTAAITIPLFLRMFAKHGPPVVYIRQGPEMPLTFSQRKYLETGDPEWLALSGPIIRAIPEAPEDGAKTYSATVVRMGDDS